MAKYEEQTDIASRGAYRDRGVVLHSLKYGEGSVIVHMLTASHGRRSYITRIGTGRRSSSSRHLFQPLFLLEFEASATNTDMHKLRQAIPSRMLCEIPFDIVKSSIAMFISEILYRLIRDQAEDPRLYMFIEESVTVLDAMESGTANFHLHFMVRLMHYLGYAPCGAWQQDGWLDIKRGSYTVSEPLHTLKIAPTVAALIHELSHTRLAALGEIALSRAERVELLRCLVDYYSFHSDAIHQVRSIDILRELFDAV